MESADLLYFLERSSRVNFSSSASFTNFARCSGEISLAGEVAEGLLLLDGDGVSSSDSISPSSAELRRRSSLLEDSFSADAGCPHGSTFSSPAPARGPDTMTFST